MPHLFSSLLIFEHKVTNGSLINVLLIVSLTFSLTNNNNDSDISNNQKKSTTFSNLVFFFETVFAILVVDQLYVVIVSINLCVSIDVQSLLFEMKCDGKTCNDHNQQHYTTNKLVFADS